MGSRMGKNEIENWSYVYGMPISGGDLSEITSNLLGLFELLRKHNEGEKSS